MTLSELASKTETFLGESSEEKLKYSKIEDCIEKLRSEFVKNWKRCFVFRRCNGG